MAFEPEVPVRRWMLSLIVAAAALVPARGSAQVYQFKTPPPEITAAGAAWQINGDPIMVAGLVFLPTRLTRFFDGSIMSEVGVYAGVPVYADVTLEPWSVVFVPVGRGLMRQYERRRAGGFAGTEGSRVPAFPVEVPNATLGPQPPTTAPVVPGPPPEPAPPPPPGAATGTAGTFSATGNFTATIQTQAAQGASGPAEPNRIESIPPPQSNAGIWLAFDGQRWYSAGPAVPFSFRRFDPIGELNGFPVYRDVTGDRNRIWVPTVPGGPVAPFERR